jgi:signal recognition particle receptor subunit beta
MPQLNIEAREITLKIVYYGPARSGKTTNLKKLHEMLAAEVRGNMVALDTQDDRTLYFDFLPVEISARGDYRIKLKLFTVPGQVLHRSTRRVVLAGADGVAFIADSQRSAAAGNAYSYRDLQANLRTNGIDADRLPQVIQFNKRDLDDVKTLEEVQKAWGSSGIPAVPAVATQGIGVIETLEALLGRLFCDLDQRHDFGRKFELDQQTFLDGIMSFFPDRAKASTPA